MNWEERYNNFLKEYEEIRNKYQMCFVIADKWELGFNSIEIYDEKDNAIVYED